MKIVILGSGNVATQLAEALRKVGEEIIQIYSRRLKNANELALKVNAKAIDNLNQVDASADVYLIAVKDDAILEVSQELKNFKGVIAHTSGATDIDVFSSEIENFGVFYPLQTFSKNRKVDFREIPICIEANNISSLETLKNLTSKLSEKIYEIDSEERITLHLAAVFVCNFSNHLYALAADILAAKGLNFDLIRPLIAETAVKVMENLPSQVQTGPAIRNDELTIKNHLELLQNSSDLKEIYEVLTRSIILKYK